MKIGNRCADSTTGYCSTWAKSLGRFNHRAVNRTTFKHSNNHKKSQKTNRRIEPFEQLERPETRIDWSSLRQKTTPDYGRWLWPRCSSQSAELWMRSNPIDHLIAISQVCTRKLRLKYLSSNAHNVHKNAVFWSKFYQKTFVQNFDQNIFWKKLKF